MRGRVAALLLVSASAPALAQPVARRPSWVSLSGAYSAHLARADRDDRSLPTLSVQFHRPLGAGRWFLQVGVSESYVIWGTNELTEGHVAVGTSVSAGPLLVAVSAGPSVGRFRRADFSAPVGRQARKGGTAGVYTSAQVVLAVFPGVGVGGEAFAALNPDLPVVGAGLTLAFGRLSRPLIR